MPDERTILVVDDDAGIVNLLKENLSQVGYRVLEGFDGQAALQLAQSGKPNLIILDVNMPVINGLKALEFLRSREDTKNIPILFLSGETSARIEPMLASAPRVAHVKKPIDLDDLNSIVHELITKYPT